MKNNDIKLNHKNALIHFISKFDIEMIKDLLEANNREFNNKELIDNLKIVFGYFQLQGDLYLESHEGKCNKCNKCNEGISFIGNNSKSYIDLIFKYENKKIIEIFDCSNFMTTKENLIKKERIFLDIIPF